MVVTLLAATCPPSNRLGSRSAASGAAPVKEKKREKHATSSVAHSITAGHGKSSVTCASASSSSIRPPWKF